ncbi:hypothetical protein CEW92_15025 [Bacillaceae bacterium SAS-127]|nr:hypothetical protein CEW92_15025 [Bacillaceae bacterium SAS-127]
MIKEQKKRAYFEKWNRTPAVSDHWLFSDPFRVEKFFDITKDNGVWISKVLEKAKSRYWGMQNAVSIEIPLVSITSPEDISTKVFQELESLPII